MVDWQQIEVDWRDIEEAYSELMAARERGETAILMRLTELQCATSEALDAQVTVCVRGGWSWQRVADAIGITRQAASKRWRAKVFPPGT